MRSSTEIINFLDNLDFERDFTEPNGDIGESFKKFGSSMLYNFVDLARALKKEQKLDNDENPDHIPT